MIKRNSTMRAVIAALRPGAAATGARGGLRLLPAVAVLVAELVRHRRDAGADAEQCAPDRDFGFVLHGLWPQDEDG